MPPGVWPTDAALNGSASAAGAWLTTKPFAVPAESSLHVNVETALSAELIIQVWRLPVKVSVAANLHVPDTVLASNVYAW